jgi:hypothetical protein
VEVVCIVRARIPLLENATNVDVIVSIAWNLVEIQNRRLVEPRIVFAEHLPIGPAKAVRAMLLVVYIEDILHPEPDEFGGH